jgi:hypothetical protein
MSHARRKLAVEVLRERPKAAISSLKRLQAVTQRIVGRSSCLIRVSTKGTQGLKVAFVPTGLPRIILRSPHARDPHFTHLLGY